MYDQQNSNNGDAPFFSGNQNVEDTAAALTSSIDGMPDPSESIIADQPPKKGMSLLLKAMIGSGVVILGLGAASVFMQPAPKAPAKKSFPTEETAKSSSSMAMPGASAPAAQVEEKKPDSPFVEEKKPEVVQAETKIPGLDATTVPPATPVVPVEQQAPVPTVVPTLIAEEKKPEPAKEVAPAVVSFEAEKPVTMAADVAKTDLPKADACEPKAKPVKQAKPAVKKEVQKKSKPSKPSETSSQGAFTSSDDDGKYWKKVF